MIKKLFIFLFITVIFLSIKSFAYAVACYGSTFVSQYGTFQNSGTCYYSNSSSPPNYTSNPGNVCMFGPFCPSFQCSNIGGDYTVDVNNLLAACGSANGGADPLGTDVRCCSPTIPSCYPAGGTCTFTASDCTNSGKVAVNGTPYGCSAAVKFPPGPSYCCLAATPTPNQCQQIGGRCDTSPPNCFSAGYSGAYTGSTYGCTTAFCCANLPPTATPTPTPLPNCTTAPNNNCTAWNATYNTCSGNNATRTCTHNGPAPCTPHNYQENGSISNCDAGSGYTCDSVNCVTTVSGRIFDDYNSNGVQDTGEPGIAGIGLSLGTTNRGTTYLTATTDGNGNWQFNGVVSGTFAIWLTANGAPSGYAITKAPDNTTNFYYTQNLGPQATGKNWALSRTFTISGHLYNDYTDPKQYYTPPGDTLLSVGTTVTIKDSNGNTVTSITSSNGTYNSGQVLLAGDYSVTLTPPSTGGYSMVYPNPPTLQVTLGNPPTPYTCTVNNAHNGNCDAQGNISELDFGLTNLHTFFQGVCTDLRADSGFVDVVPNSGTCGTMAGGIAANNGYASIIDNTCTVPGVIYSGDNTFNFGTTGGAASTTNWVVGGGTYPEDFTPVNPTVIRTSYSYVLDTATHAGITPTDLAGLDTSTGNPFCFGGTSGCELEDPLPNGVYKVNGNLTLLSTSGTYSFAKNKAYIFIINGNLNIQTKLYVPTGSFVLFTTAGDISVEANVGENDVTSWDADLQGFYSADGSFIVKSNITANSTCNPDGSSLDNRLNITGSVVVNAAGNGGTFQNFRDLCTGDLSCPTYTVSMGNGNPSGNVPDAGIGSTYLLYAPAFIKHQNTVWQEQNAVTPQ